MFVLSSNYNDQPTRHFSNKRWIDQRSIHRRLCLSKRLTSDRKYWLSESGILAECSLFQPRYPHYVSCPVKQWKDVDDVCLGTSPCKNRQLVFEIEFDVRRGRWSSLVVVESKRVNAFRLISSIEGRSERTIIARWWETGRTETRSVPIISLDLAKARWLVVAGFFSPTTSPPPGTNKFNFPRTKNRSLKSESRIAPIVIVFI